MWSVFKFNMRNTHCRILRRLRNYINSVEETSPHKYSESFISAVRLNRVKNYSRSDFRRLSFEINIVSRQNVQVKLSFLEVGGWFASFRAQSILWPDKSETFHGPHNAWAQTIQTYHSYRFLSHFEFCRSDLGRHFTIPRPH